MKQDEKQLQSKGIWSQFTADKYHQSSPKLAGWLASFLDIEKPVIDFGCGNAFYCHELASVGFHCLGVEGYRLNNFLHDNILVADLTTPLHISVRGSVICLEVLEHIDKKYESILLNTIERHCDRQLVLSWAITGQPGIGHVNCVDQYYAIEQLEKRGFTYLKTVTLHARQHIDKNTDWFERTLLVFERA